MPSAKSLPIEDTFAETRVLLSLLTCVENGEGCPETDAVRTIFEAHTPKDAESWLRHCAMAKVLNEPCSFPAGFVFKGNAVDRIFVRGALAWAAWASGQAETARTLLNDAEAQEGGNEIHRMAIEPWCRAVEALVQGDLNEARRYFRRATEIGSQLGTETNSAIQWAYVATFFEHKPPTYFVR